MQWKGFRAAAAARLPLLARIRYSPRRAVTLLKNGTYEQKRLKFILQDGNRFS
jgi:hypothetical protein